MNRSLIPLFALLMAFVAVGCSDDASDPVEDECTTAEDCGGDGWLCVEGQCVAEAGDITTTPDTTEDVTDPADTVLPDTPVEPDTVEEVIDYDAEPPMDVEFPDINTDVDPPEVVATTPADGEDNVNIPFTVTVTFNEPIKTTTIAPLTFKVIDVNDNEISGSFSFQNDDTVVVFTPSEPLLAASPYEVTLKGPIMDLAGNKLAEWYVFNFYTRPPLDLEVYEALAAKYAPVINVQTDQTSPWYDYITKFDFDGDWDGTNNITHIISGVSKVPADVYYAVIESKTHYFITYMFYWPYRSTDTVAQNFGNDASGLTIVVEKYPEERPVAAQVYFKNMEVEEMPLFVTNESGIVPDGSDKDVYNVTELFDQAVLFPPFMDGYAFQSFLSTESHQSCPWIWENDSITMQYCQLNAGIKQSMTKIQYIYKDGTEESIDKVDNAFPTELEDVGYALESLLVKLWSRRTAEGVFGDSIDAYNPPAGRPGSNIQLGKSFVNPIPDALDKGRPPWAWKWEPGIGYKYEAPRGTPFLDPAYFFGKRTKLADDGDTFNPDDQTGYSLDYCFNPFLNIDQRTTSEDCQ